MHLVYASSTDGLFYNPWDSASMELDLVGNGEISRKRLAPQDFIRILSNVENIVRTHLKLIVPLNDSDLFCIMIYVQRNLLPLCQESH